MSNPSENAVKVRVEVEVPLGGGPVVHGFKDDRRGEKSVVVITEPPPPDGMDPAVVLVRVEGPALANKFICAKGTALKNGLKAVHVVGRVYPGFLSISTIHLVPPPCDPLVRCFVPTNQYWEFTQVYGNELPGADCADEKPYAENTLVVWGYFNDGVYSAEIRHFYGECSDRTSCQASGSGSGGSSSSGHQLKQVPEALYGTITARKGDFQALPDKGKLVKAAGKPHWMWQGGPKGFEFDLVAGTHHGRLGFRLRSRAFRPSLIRPRGKLSMRPLYLAFDVTGRGAAAGNRGSFTIVISE